MDTHILDTLNGATITTATKFIEDFDNNEIIDELYDLEDGIEDEDGMITDSDLEDWDDDDEDEIYDLEDDVHDDV